ncbi:MAG TPA: FAD-binding oxidoreductase [Ktedonobacterales bacterium]|nr:FAD-binding oxidoreductase [Ktedonobacterales bacterium]
MMNDLKTTATSSDTQLDDAAIAELKARFRGVLLRPGDEGYNAARSIWNGMIDKRPALIARCTGTADVIAAANFARTHHLLLAVRGGGHNVAGTALCDGGLVIDLSAMRGVQVDPSTRVAHVQPGLTWGDLDHETQVFGLATPGGIVSATGVAGLTLGGGFGWLSRKYGLTVDNLRSVKLVTADGHFVTASERENPDLFWGLRGGGGNFGVVTSFEFQLHPVGPQVMAGLVFYPIEQAHEVLRFYREYAASAPDELSTMAVLRIAPPAPFLPKHFHGTPVIGIAACYAGSLEEGERVLRPLKNFGAPIADIIEPKPFVRHQMLLDTASPNGRHYYWKSEYLPELSDAALETVIGYSRQLSSPLTAVLLFQLGGAIRQVDEQVTAAGHRNAEFVLNIQSAWLEPGESPQHMLWTREFWTAMRPFSTGGVYINFMSMDEDEERVRAAYGSNYDRLVSIKTSYDPTNLFRVNQNIKPAV